MFLFLLGGISALNLPKILEAAKIGEILPPETRKKLETWKSQIDEILKIDDQQKKVSQKISPAFQWTQNATHIFVAVKFTRRWNAPGALQVTHPAASFSDETFTFSGEVVAR